MKIGLHIALHKVLCTKNVRQATEDKCLINTIYRDMHMMQLQSETL